jgi:hypothetical protein
MKFLQEVETSQHTLDDWIEAAGIAGGKNGAPFPGSPERQQAYQNR